MPGPAARAGTVAEAVEFGEVVLLVVPYGAIEQIGKDHGSRALAAKPLVIDVSNPIARRDGDDLVKSVEQQGGAGLVTAKLVPGVHLVRAFNAINFAALPKDANRPGEPLGILMAGGRPEGDRASASRLIKEIGFEPVPSSAAWRKATPSSRERRSAASIRRPRSARSPRSFT